MCFSISLKMKLFHKFLSVFHTLSLLSFVSVEIQPTLDLIATINAEMLIKIWTETAMVSYLLHGCIFKAFPFSFYSYFTSQLQFTLQLFFFVTMTKSPNLLLFPLWVSIICEICAQILSTAVWWGLFLLFRNTYSKLADCPLQASVLRAHSV